ncbi:MAG: GTPase [Candidatus Eisenbacteria bacterium]
MSSSNSREAEALATIGLLAAQADGRRDASEMARLSEVFASFSVAGIRSVHARVALGTAALDEESRALASPGMKQLAWELALGVCHADGQIVERERAFLEELRRALALAPETVATTSATAAALAPLPAAAAVALALAATTERATPAALPPDVAAGIEQKIREAAILTGALELLPQGLATLAIVPVQVKLVADIGTAHGHAVDLGHARELLATVGLGLSGQAVEGFARRFLGRLAGRFGGGGVGTLVNAAAGAAATFAATWAIGQVAQSWYASGRTLDATDVQARFGAGLEEGRAAFGRLQDTVAAKAGTIALPDVARWVGR